MLRIYLFPHRPFQTRKRPAHNFLKQVACRISKERNSQSVHTAFKSKTFALTRILLLHELFHWSALRSELKNRMLGHLLNRYVWGRWKIDSNATEQVIFSRSHKSWECAFLSRIASEPRWLGALKRCPLWEAVDSLSGKMTRYQKQKCHPLLTLSKRRLLSSQAAAKTSMLLLQKTSPSTVSRGFLFSTLARAPRKRPNRLPRGSKRQPSRPL